MVRKTLKWVGYALAGLLGLLVLGFTLVYYITETRLNQVYEIQPAAVTVSESPPVELTSYQRMLISFCTECHGPGMGGMMMENDPMVAVLGAPNLTRGQGGVAGSLDDSGWVRAIRHGVGRDGQSLLVMPSNLFNHLSDADLAVIIAHVKSLPPVENQIPEITLGPMGRWFVLQDPSILVAAVIDHQMPRPPDPQPAVSVEYGRYLAVVCTTCHAENMAGGPSESSGLNLTPAGDLGSWTEADFLHAIRTGETPEGETMDPVEMPWKEISLLSDDDLKAIWLYLQTLPPVETAQN